MSTALFLSPATYTLLESVKASKTLPVETLKNLHKTYFASLNDPSSPTSKVETLLGEMSLQIQKIVIPSVGFFPSFERFTNLTHLEAPSTGLTDFPEIFCLKKLQRLDLSFNLIKKIPEKIRDLASLRVLIIPNNDLQSIPKAILALENLNVADFKNNKIPKSPGVLVGKTFFEENFHCFMKGNPFCQDYEPYQIIYESKENKVPEEKSPQKKKRSSRSKKTSSPPPISNFELFPLLRSIRASHRLSKASLRKLHSAYNSFLSQNSTSLELKGSLSPEIEKLFTKVEKDIETLILPSISEIPKSIERFHSLRHLSASSLNLKNFPFEILNLTNLERLDLRGNEIKTIPEDICDLRKLSFFMLAFNRLSSLPGSIYDLNLRFLDLRNNLFEKITEPLNVKSSFEPGFIIKLAGNPGFKEEPTLFFTPLLSTKKINGIDIQQKLYPLPFSVDFEEKGEVALENYCKKTEIKSFTQISIKNLVNGDSFKDTYANLLHLIYSVAIPTVSKPHRDYKKFLRSISRLKKKPTKIDDFQYALQILNTIQPRVTSVRLHTPDVPNNLSKYFPRLALIDGSGMGFTSIPELKGVPNLEKLILDDNKITKIPEDFHKKHPKLREISLKRNPINAININPPQIFAPPTAPQYIPGKNKRRSSAL